MTVDPAQPTEPVEPSGPAEVALEAHQPPRRARATRLSVAAICVTTAMTIAAAAAAGGGGGGVDDEDTGWVRTLGTVPPELIVPVSTGDAGIEPSELLGDRAAPRRADGAAPPVGAATTTPGDGPRRPRVVARPIPAEPAPAPADPGRPPPPWAGSTRPTPEGFLATDVGCVDDRSAPALDAFFRQRLGPVIGHDYQHVYPLGDDRFLWLFQDTFLDHPGAASRLDQASFVHNTAMVQDGECFTLYHRGTASSPASFEPGAGESRLSRWFWPLGGELVGDRLYVFWAEMTKDSDPAPDDGLGWHPVTTWVGTYDAATLARLAFHTAPNSGVRPIYGYAVASDDTHTYLFGNTYDQNLSDDGGFYRGKHSTTKIWLARTPRGHPLAPPEYRTASGWSREPSDAIPILDRYYAENPMQPRYLDGRWVATTKIDGFWAITHELAVDVANDPWGPWTTAARHVVVPHGGDPLMNLYHAHLMPWLDDGGNLIVSISQNARDMQRDAWPAPARYRLQFLTETLPVAPPPTTTSTTTTTAPPRSSTTTTSVPGPPPRSTTTSSTTTSSTSIPGTTTTSSSTTSTSTSTSTSSTTSTTSAPTTTKPPCRPTTTSSTVATTTSTSTTVSGATTTSSTTTTTTSTTVAGGTTSSSSTTTSTTTSTLPPCRD